MTSRKGSPRRRSDWSGTRTALMSEEERELIGNLTVLHQRVHVPGQDPEPPQSSELIDRDGTVWRRDNHAGRDGWAPEGGDDMALKWTAPAMAFAGPFIGPRRRTREEISADKASAARARWAQEQKRMGVAA